MKALLLCLIFFTRWVNMDSLKAIIEREKMCEFWMDREGNLRVNAVRESTVVHYIISPKGRTEKIIGDLGPHISSRVYLLSNQCCFRVFEKDFVQKAPLQDDIILLTPDKLFLDDREDFLIYEYRISRENKNINFSRTIIFPGKKIYELRLGRCYAAWVGGGAPLRARLVALGEDYAMIHIAAYDTIWAVPPPPGVEFMRYPPSSSDVLHNYL